MSRSEARSNLIKSQAEEHKLNIKGDNKARNDEDKLNVEPDIMLSNHLIAFCSIIESLFDMRAAKTRSVELIMNK